MQPTHNDVHIDAALSNLSVGFKNQQFIADRVFPSVGVRKKSDQFFVFMKGSWFRNEAGIRGPGSPSRQAGYRVSVDTYACTERSVAHKIPIEVLDNADDVLSPMETGVRFVSNAIELSKEVEVSSLCMTPGNWTFSEDLGGAWAQKDETNSFLSDVLAKKELLRKQTGYEPNRMLMDSGTFTKLKEAGPILERIKYTGTQGKPADVTANTLAQLLELEEILIGKAIHSPAEEEADGSDFTPVDLWEANQGKGSALLFYTPPSPGIEIPSAGYVFSWIDRSALPEEIVASGHRRIRRWWEKKIKSWIIEGAEFYDARVICPEAGCLFLDTIQD